MQYKLYALRKHKGLTQEDMAEKLGITPTTYRNKELGHTFFNAKEMFKISDLFQKPLDDIFLPSEVQSWNKKGRMKNEKV